MSAKPEFNKASIKPCSFSESEVLASSLTECLRYKNNTNNYSKTNNNFY